jgi:predicted nucleic acid-binding protein
MLRVVDASVLLAIAKGNILVIQQLMLTRKGEVAVPEPVIVHTGIEVRSLTEHEAVERWQRVVDVMPRLPWTAEVTEALLDLEPPSGLAVDLDAITAAHAVAKKAAVFTREPERYAWIRRLRIEAL